LLLEGKDPIEHRKNRLTAMRLDAARTMTFSACASAYIEAHKSGWKNEKHANQWKSTIDTYVNSIIGELPIGDVDSGLVMKCLNKIWNDKPETASRVRGRIESILDWAKVLGYRAGENPARWKGHLDNLLPARSKVARVEHHPALPYAEIPDFMVALKQQPGFGARALEFSILNATRTGEVIGAKWDEVDLDAALWIIPAERMKAGEEHRVPLSSSAVAILQAIQPLGEAFLFPGRLRNTPLSNMSLLATLKRMNRNDLTTHGFRSTFRDWAAETTVYPSEVVEMSLAHTIGSKVEAAYRRGDLLEKRRRLMDDWATYCMRTST